MRLLFHLVYNNVDQGGLPAPTSLRRVSKNLRSRELPANKKKHSNGDGPDGPTSSCPDSNDPIRHATCPTNNKNSSHGDGPDFVMPRLKCSYSSCRLLAHNASGTEKNKGDSVFQSAVPVTGCKSPGHNASGTKKNKDDSIFPLPSLSTGYGDNRQNCSATTPSYVGRLGTEPRSASQTLARSLGDK